MSIETNFLYRLTKLWWFQIPKWLKRHPILFGSLTDGFYLVQWPIVAAFTPPVALALSFLAGAKAPGETFSSSLLLLLALIIPGIMSAHLGLWVVFGYSLGNLFFHEQWSYVSHPLAVLFQVKVPLVLSYLLLALAVVIIPLVLTAARLRVRSLKKPLVEFVLGGLLISGLIWVWALATIVLIRPVFTWQGSQPTTSAIEPLQVHTWALALGAFTAFTFRFFLERQARSDHIKQWIRELQQSTPPVEQQPITGLLQHAGLASVLTFLMSGMMGRWFEAALVWTFLFFLLWLRHKLATTSFPLIRLLTRVPWILRFIISIGLGYALSHVVVSALWQRTNTFQPVLLSTCLSLAITTLIVGVGQKAKRQNHV
ncbi:MAG: hypothetical protein ACRCYY_05090 [Trueperaceae bacterium]